jgi:hypothetical protein
MRRTSRSLVIAGVAVAIGATACARSAAACFRHTFEPCPATSSSDYVVEVDSKTGRTWIKDRPANADEMAALAANAAKRLALRPVVAPADGEWKTQIRAGTAGAPRSN